MQWASAVSEETSLEAAVADCAAAIRGELGASPDLAFAFVSDHHQAGYARLPGLIEGALAPSQWLGCSAGGVIGAGHEVEQRPGFSLTAALLPGAELDTLHLDARQVWEVASAPERWSEILELAPEEEAGLVLLADPFSFDSEVFLGSLDRTYPLLTKAGGLASGGREPGTNALFVGGRLASSGAVAVVLRRGVAIDTVVAQGCRPIGAPMFVTRCERNLVRELDGRVPYEVLTELYESLDERDRALCQNSLFLGIAMLPARVDYAQGDFLIRNLVGLDRDSGALAVGAQLESRGVVQFHLRDAETSREDLLSMLLGYRRQSPVAPAGALLFSCLGRGEHLYGRADHDTDVFRECLGPVPLGGFFCNGEIGPVHGRTFLHGYTSSFALFRSA